MVLAPYGLLQSLLRDRDLMSTLAEVRRVLRPGGTFGMELVADLPAWKEYRQRVSLKGWRNRPGGSHVTLVETVPRIANAGSRSSIRSSPNVEVDIVRCTASPCPSARCLCHRWLAASRKRDSR